jgi:Fe-S-cluster containining protein
MMITRMRGPLGERVYDGEIGRFVESGLIPCHRCGVCCERWQPMVGVAEIERLATFLGIDGAELTARYTEPYPFDDETRLLRRTDGGCVFLQRDGTGRSLCSVHPARPDACRAWLAALDRPECVAGLDRFAAGDLVSVITLYPDEEERRDFVRTMRGAVRCGDA